MAIYKCFPGGRYKALTLSYDDGKVEDRRLIEILNRYGLKGTFNLNSGWMGRPDMIGEEEVKELYQGHEVACHTYSHPTLERCPLSEVIDEIMKDRRKLEQLVGYPVRGMAYPNGSYNREIIKLLPSLGLEYARIVGDSDDFGIPKDYYAWQATCHHNHKLMENAKRFVETSKSQYLFLMYVWGHSYEFNIHHNWELMEEFARFVGGREEIWYATNIELVDYMKLLDRLIYSAAKDMIYNPSARSAWLSVDGRIVEIKGGEQVHLS